MFKSIRWKFIIIYFLLVFIAMIIAGVFIIEFFEQYQLDIISDRLQDLSELMIPNIETYDNLENYEEEIEQIIASHKGVGFREEIYVVSGDNNRILATSTENKGYSALDVLSVGSSLIPKALNGEANQEIINSGDIRTMDSVFPITHEGEVLGVLYLRYDLKDTYQTLDRSKIIIIQATILALFITVILGYIIANSITKPINDVTEKAYKMAKGDFNQYVDVKSSDEIGKLAEMFNHLTQKLKLTLSEISREKSKMEAIVNYMADGLIAIDENGKVIHINPKACSIFNLNPVTLEEFSFNEVVGTYNPELTLSYISVDENPWLGSGKLEMDDHIYLVNYAPFENDEGLQKGLVFVFQDITEQQRLDHMRREFVANVSHELKTPLTSIKSYTETLLDGMLSDEAIAKQFLTVVDGEADRMTRLVRDLLQLSNFDANAVQFDMEYHDYVDLVQKSTQKFEMTAKNKNQTLSTFIDVENMVGYFDYDRVEQVLVNIVSNALKYTPEGGDVTVRLTEADQRAVIQVKDTGMGIPQKDLQHIFDRFYRVDKARSREMGGTGLGLSIAKEIVMAHQGQIDIESVVEEGTQVKITIPLETA